MNEYLSVSIIRMLSQEPFYQSGPRTVTWAAPATACLALFLSYFYRTGVQDQKGNCLPFRYFKSHIKDIYHVTPFCRVEGILAIKITKRHICQSSGSLVSQIATLLTILIASMLSFLKPNCLQINVRPCKIKSLKLRD